MLQNNYGHMARHFTGHLKAQIVIPAKKKQLDSYLPPPPHFISQNIYSCQIN